MIQSLSVSIVIYNQQVSELKTCIEYILEGIKKCITTSNLNKFHMLIVDNGLSEKLDDVYLHDYNRQLSHIAASLELITSDKNLGFGQGHNIAVKQLQQDNKLGEAHLILNADTEVPADTLLKLIDCISKNDISACSAQGYDKNGNPQHLAKRLPTPYVLFCRATGWKWPKQYTQQKTNHYCYADTDLSNHISDVILLSGCLLMAKSDYLIKAGGFSDKYFLFFEDYDLTLKLKKYGRTVTIPEGFIHHGGKTSNKALKIKLNFIISALKWFRNKKVT